MRTSCKAYRMSSRRPLRSRQCSPSLVAPKSITVFAVIMAPGFTFWLHLPVSVKDLVAATAGCIVGLGEEDRVAGEGLDRVLGVLQVVAHGDSAWSNSQRSRGRGMSVRGGGCRCSRMCRLLVAASPGFQAV
jgi:hypothetical protein